MGNEKEILKFKNLAYNSIADDKNSMIKYKYNSPEYIKRFYYFDTNFKPLIKHLISIGAKDNFDLAKHYFALGVFVLDENIPTMRKSYINKYFKFFRFIFKKMFFPNSI